MNNWLPIAANLGTFVSAMLALVTIIVGIRTYKRQTNAQIFLEYTSRYHEVMASFPSGCRASRLDSDGDPPPPSAELSLAILRYLNLCSEEFYLCRQRYLAKGVWRIWEAELQRTLRSKLLRREWAALKGEFAAYPAFVGYVEAVQAQNSTTPELGTAGVAPSPKQISLAGSGSNVG